MNDYSELINELREFVEMVDSPDNNTIIRQVKSHYAQAANAIDALTVENEKQIDVNKALENDNYNLDMNLEHIAAELSELREEIETALKLIEEESKRHKGKTENVDFHSGVIYALGYTIGVFPDTMQKG